jgi:hypothetical protein
MPLVRIDLSKDASAELARTVGFQPGRGNPGASV